MPKPAVESVDHQGMPALRLRSGDGSSVLVTAYGAHVLSWRTADGRERLFLSERAVFKPGTAIRGGIPVIFPQFGPNGPLPRHGFARVLDWTPGEGRAGDDHATNTWTLRDGPQTRAIWPHAFLAELTVSVSAGQLDVELSIENTGDGAFDFTGALHTYLQVHEVEHATIQGLAQRGYVDQTAGGAKRRQDADGLVVDTEVDRIYGDAPPHLTIVEPRNRTIIRTLGWPDVVVWNPWEAQTARITDMAPDGFRHMLCVEPAVAIRPQTVRPGEIWVGRQTLVVANGPSR